MPSKQVEELLNEKKISQVINPRLVQMEPEVPLERALAIVLERRSGYAVIAKNKKVLGLFTEADLTLKILGKKVDYNRPVSDFMTGDPVVLRTSDTVGTAVAMMAQTGFYHIPLVNDAGELDGVLSVRSLIRFLAEFYPKEVYNLPPDPHQVSESREGG